MNHFSIPVPGREVGLGAVVGSRNKEFKLNNSKKLV